MDKTIIMMTINAPAMAGYDTGNSKIQFKHILKKYLPKHLSV